MPHRVVEEELALLEQLLAALKRGESRALPTEDSARSEVERVREELLAGGGETDRAALAWEYNRQTALIEQLRRARQAVPVARDSPYFGHLRLEEDGEAWDVCLGKGTFIEGAVRIVDWRNAPISRLFYRYGQGESYEESIAGRTRSGIVVARRVV